MPFEDVLKMACDFLDERGHPGLEGAVNVVRISGRLPEDVQLRRSFGTMDDRAAAEVLADHIVLAELRRRVRPGAAKLLSHAPHLVDTWALCEVLRRLGFPSHNMVAKYGVLPGHGEVFYVELESGSLSFLACSARLEGRTASAEEAFRGWDSLWRDIEEAGEDDLSILLARSAMGEMSRVVALVVELSARGFVIPAALKREGVLSLLAPSPTILSRGGVS